MLEQNKPDERFRVEVLVATPLPQFAVWRGMHQDYTAEFVFDDDVPATHSAAGLSCVNALLKGERGHYGPLEHPQITFNCGWFPHSVMQQARTHRIGISFDVQSFRYTSDRVLQAARGEIPIEEAFYVRPVGFYTNRQGAKYHYSAEARWDDLELCCKAAQHYAARYEDGCPEEQARGMLPFDYRQHFVVSFTLRALLHFLDLRSKLDAQLEIRQLCDLMWPHLCAWSPEIAEWYEKARLHKARLAP